MESKEIRSDLMELSLFLAKLLGIYFLVLSINLLLRRGEFESAVKNLASSNLLLFNSGSSSLLAGLAIVIGHQVYTIDWQGLITLIGYILILRGILLSTLPALQRKKFASFFHDHHWVFFSILLIVGAYLTYSGFMTTIIS